MVAYPRNQPKRRLSANHRDLVPRQAVIGCLSARDFLGFLECGDGRLRQHAGSLPRCDRDGEGVPVNHPIDHDPDDASIYRHVHAQAVHCLTCISPLPFAPRANPVDKLLLRFPSSLTEGALTAVRPNAPLRYGPGQFDRLLGDLADEHSHYSGERGPGLMCTVAVIPAAEVLEGCPLSAWKRLCACGLGSL